VTVAIVVYKGLIPVVGRILTNHQPTGEVHLDKHPDGQPDTCQQNIQPHARHVRGGCGGQLR